MDLKKWIYEGIKDEDLSDITAPEVALTESESYPNDLIFKYYSAERRGFFRRPNVRFTQRTVLNDPFELSKRWKEFGSVPVKELFHRVVQKQVARFVADATVFSEFLRDQIAKEKYNTDPACVNALLSSAEGVAFRENLGTHVVPTVVRVMCGAYFQTMREKADAWIESLTARFGILSFSEDGLSQPMWGLYSTSERGFSVAFDSKCPLLQRVDASGTSHSVLRKVRYSNEITNDFWTNPYILFLVKDVKWSFEHEWRVMRELSACDKHDTPDGEPVYTVDMPIGAIREITFGYNYNQNNVKYDAELISAFDSNIKITKIVADRETQTLARHVVV